MRPFISKVSKKAIFVIPKNIYYFYRRKKKSVTFWGLGLGTGIAVLAIIQLVARADFLHFYPAVCSGEWENPQNAVSRSEPQDPAQSASFLRENAAVWNGGIDKTIVCGGFSGEEAQVKILRVRLNLSWMFKAKDVPTENPEILPNPSEASDNAEVAPDANPVSGSVEQTTMGPASAAPAAILDVNNEDAASEEGPIALPDSLPDQPPSQADQNPSAAPASEPKMSEPAEQPPSAPETVPADTALPAEPAPVSQDNNSTSENPSSAPEPSAPPAQDALPSGGEQSFLGLAPRVFAQEVSAPSVTASLVFNGLEHFLDVQYSLDGEQWLSVDNANLELPLATMEDVKNVQIRLVVLRDGADLPDIYLDNVWLEVKYLPQETAVDEATSAEQLAQAAETEPTLVENIVETISEIPQTIQEFFGGDNGSQNGTPEVSVENQTNNNSEEMQKPSQPRPEYRLNLAGREAVSDHAYRQAGGRQDLPGDAQDFSAGQTAGQIETNVRVAGDGKSLFVEGACSLKYFAVLVFVGKDDWITDPSRAVLNRAGLCQGGSYSFELKSDDLPLELADGTYYLLPAEQTEGEPWRAGKYRFNIEIRRK